MDEQKKAASAAYKEELHQIEGKLIVIWGWMNVTREMPVNWGHVGNARHVAEKLDEICNFIATCH